MVRIVVFEKGLEDKIEFVRAKTRTQESWYYTVNPSGRVPYLVLDDGTGIEESHLIIRYLDHYDGHPVFDYPDGDDGWALRRLEARARSLIDGLSVWVRELARPEEDRSATIIAHEKERARRLTTWWDREIGHALMNGPLNIAQITLICALKLEERGIDFVWREQCPALAQWAGRIAALPSAAKALPKDGRNYLLFE